MVVRVQWYPEEGLEYTIVIVLRKFDVLQSAQATFKVV